MAILTYKYRLKGKRNFRQLRRMAWAVNQVWNHCVASQRLIQRAWKEGLSPTWLPQYDLQKLTGGTSKDLRLHAQTIQDVCKQFVKSRDQHKKCPGFRRSGGSRRSLGWVPGLKSLVTLSTGEKIEAPRTYRLYEEKLIIAQRARKTDRVRALHDKIANVRRDHLHKLSTRLVHLHKAIYVGDVSSSQLGRTRMAKSVYDASWSTFRGMLRYKASRHGVKYAEVDEAGSTQICSTCGDFPPTRPKGIADLGIREWVCSSCGASHDRDVNAARNILATGLSAQPLVEGSRVAYGR